MGDRAHYVVKGNGSWERYYSQWGGRSMELDLLAGPEPAIRFARGQRTVDWWMNDAECVGAALIDHDERRLLWCSSCGGDVAYRAVVLAVMARTWPGWRIDWACDGLGEILDALGQDRRQVRSPRTLPVPEDIRTPEEFTAAMPQFTFDPEIYPPGQELPRELPLGKATLRQADPSDVWDVCLVTVVREGRVRAYMVDDAPDRVIENGAGSLERYYRLWSPVTSWPSFPAGGVHLDADVRTGGVWTGGTLHQVLDETDGLWPGWRWEAWQDRYHEQFGRAAGAIALPEPDHGRGLRKLVEKFDSHQEADSATQSLSLLLDVTGALTAMAERSGLEVRTVTDSGFAHRPMDLTDTERAEVHAAFNTLHADGG